MKLFIATDHGALEQKNQLVSFLIEELGYQVEDLGTHSNESCHYPEYAISLAEKVIKENGRGILLCGSGIGVSVVANKFKGITAALCRSVSDAKLSRQHNNSNVICFGGRASSIENIKEMTQAWLDTDFEGGRHEIRTDMFKNLGEEVK